MIPLEKLVRVRTNVDLTSSERTQLTLKPEVKAVEHANYVADTIETLETPKSTTTFNAFRRANIINIQKSHADLSVKSRRNSGRQVFIKISANQSKTTDDIK